MSGSSFINRIETLAYQSGLKVADTKSGRAELEFAFDSDGKHTSQTVWIYDYDGIWEFSCLSFVKYQDADDFPKSILVYALKENRKKYRGFWCLKEFDSDTVYLDFMDNRNSDLMTADEFHKTCWNTARQVDILERYLSS